MPTPTDAQHTHTIMYDCVQGRRRIGFVCGVFAKDDGEATANASLIAAAPSLLAALKMWMELETTCDGRRPCYCDDPEIAPHGKCYACVATDAIAQAEGITMEEDDGKERSLD
jgi:hypothetical protein